MFISSLCCKSLIWVPFTAGPPWTFLSRSTTFISLCSCCAQWVLWAPPRQPFELCIWYISILFCPFTGVLFCSFIGATFAPIRQPPCVCFCVSGRAAFTACKRHLLTLWGRALGDDQGGATHFITLWLVWREGLERGQCRCLASGDLPGTFPATLPTWLVPFQLLPWCWIPEQASLCTVYTCAGPLSRVYWKSGKLFCHPNPHWFLQPEVTGIYLPGTRTLGWDPFAPKVLLPMFIHHTWIWDRPCPFHHQHLSAPHGVSSPVSAPPTCLDECGFFKSLVVRLPYTLIFWQFWALRFSCNSFAVTWGSKVYLPMPPSWLEVMTTHFYSIHWHLIQRPDKCSLRRKLPSSGTGGCIAFTSLVARVEAISGKACWNWTAMASRDLELDVYPQAPVGIVQKLENLEINLK